MTLEIPEELLHSPRIVLPSSFHISHAARKKLFSSRKHERGERSLSRNGLRPETGIRIFRNPKPKNRASKDENGGTEAERTGDRHSWAVTEGTEEFQRAREIARGMCVLKRRREAGE
ncbi:hypothetical protein NL676_033585 [Syzygium grande]|nr:hypothetical protein NL676_033585 [Syzygium grande]